MAEYVSIKEFAEMAGVSQQSIYKRIKKEDNPIQPYIKRLNNKPMISIEALILYNKDNYIMSDITVDDTYQNNEEIIENKNNDDTRKILEEQIIFYKEQLKEKDKQINMLLDRIKETTKALDQQQQLTMIDKKTIFELEEKIKEKENENEIERPKKWYQRIFSI